MLLVTGLLKAGFHKVANFRYHFANFRYHFANFRYHSLSLPVTGVVVEIDLSFAAAVGDSKTAEDLIANIKLCSLAERKFV